MPQDQQVNPAIARALALLTDEERPTLPVETIDPDPAKNPIFRVRPKTEGITDAAQKKIFISNSAPSFKDDALLAAILAHEAEHARHLGMPEQYEEGPAYQRQYAVLQRLGYKDQAYMKALKKEMDARAKEDRKRK